MADADRRRLTDSQMEYIQEKICEISNNPGFGEVTIKIDNGRPKFIDIGTSLVLDVVDKVHKPDDGK
jgi:hypothetical protein